MLSENQKAPAAGVAELIPILEQEAAVLARMRQALEHNRTMFVSLGAARLEAGLQNLQGLRQEMEGLEKRRTQVLTAWQAAQGGKHPKRIQDLLPHLATAQQQALTRAARQVRQEARRVRVETSVGTRLLQLSEQANQSILQGLLQLQEPGGGYDGQARSGRPAPAPGRLIDGVL